uniref:Integrator complex subunit 4/Protein SIEL C-terminal Ig-like domain-containing protein n=1 Tax=Spongospora subterranea TaxID=70186 RepID=A0A0H5R7G5_9EUKA|eukprot:CRZ10048.1 hypothetical protein [Spongospora subterranea]
MAAIVAAGRSPGPQPQHIRYSDVTASNNAATIVNDPLWIYAQAANHRDSPYSFSSYRSKFAFSSDSFVKNLMQISLCQSIHRSDIESIISDLSRACSQNIGAPIRASAIYALGLISDVSSQARIYFAMKDAHFLVRSSAARALSNMALRGIRTEPSALPFISSLVDDESWEVRRDVAILLHHMAWNDSSYAVGAGSSSQTFGDTVFIALCHLCMDPVPNVRIAAMRSIGARPSNVSSRLLLQTFSKIPLSDLLNQDRSSSRLQFDHTDIDDIVNQGGLSEVFRSDFPFPESAAGIFVHGLEDEYSTVRQFTIDAISSFGHHSPVFAGKSLDFLVDMFNDELSDIRNEAIRAVKAMLRYSTETNLSPTQLETTLCNLVDQEPSTRYEALDLISSLRVLDLPSLQSVAVKLLQCLSSFPDSHRNTFDAIRTVAKNHSKAIPNLIQQWCQADASFFENWNKFSLSPSVLGFLLFLQAAEPSSEDFLPKHLNDLLEFTQHRLSVEDVSPRVRIWIPCQILINAFQNLLGALKAGGFSEVQTLATNLIVLIDNDVKQQKTGGISGLLQFSRVYAEWFANLGSLVSSNCQEPAICRERLHSLIYSMEYAFFGFSNHDRLKVQNIRNITWKVAAGNRITAEDVASLCWWPVSCTSIKYADIRINAPKFDPELPIRVGAQYVSAVPVEAAINFLYRPRSLMLRLKISETRSFFFKPELREFSLERPGAYSLRTEIRISPEHFPNIRKDAQLPVEIGFVWRDARNGWLCTPTKVLVVFA